MAMRALKTYGPPGRADEMKQRLDHGKQWLLHTEPAILEDMDMRLAGVAAAGASAAELHKTGATHHRHAALRRRLGATPGFSQ